MLVTVNSGNIDQKYYRYITRFPVTRSCVIAKRGSDIRYNKRIAPK